jgi:type I restriction enzyme R subunit
VDTSEAAFEARIVRELVDKGYSRRLPGDYDRERCLDAGMLLDFVQATQPKAWNRLEAAAKEKAAGRLVERVFRDVSSLGTSHVFHEGVKVSGI